MFNVLLKSNGIVYSFTGPITIVMSNSSSTNLHNTTKNVNSASDIVAVDIRSTNKSSEIINAMLPVSKNAPTASFK